MLLQWQTGIVKKIEQAAPNTRRYWVELPETTSFDFKPGQFITLDLPIHEQRNKRWRSYSIASVPDGGNTIELLIVHLEGGAASGYIFNEIKEGSTLTLRGPQGVFLLPDISQKDICMVCTGAGIAPFRSMLRHILENEIPHKNIHLIFGTRTQQDILYRDEMEALQQIMPGFYYHNTLSREEWEGNKGYVHAIYEQLCASKQPAIFMLCGWRPMIDEAKQRILAMGYDKKDIIAELYG
jgi:CDP-4-dehydro-6-deoxyglucose reductase